MLDSTVKWHMTSTDSAIEVFPGIYLSGLPQERPSLAKYGAVLSILTPPLSSYGSVLADLPQPHLFIGLNDDDQALLLPHLHSCIDFISCHRQANANVLVHCMQGVSRSVCVILAYRLSSPSTQPCSLEECLCEIQRKTQHHTQPSAHLLLQVSVFVYNHTHDWGTLIRKLLSSSFKVTPTSISSITKSELISLVSLFHQQLKHKQLPQLDSFITCKKCRFHLISSACIDQRNINLTDTHNTTLRDHQYVECIVPAQWMIDHTMSSIAADGRLRCPQCHNRIGSFSMGNVHEGVIASFNLSVSSVDGLSTLSLNSIHSLIRQPG